MTTRYDPLKLADALSNPRRWTELTDEECEQAAAELRRLHNLNQEWQQKAATWLASPAAAQRLDGYRDLSKRLQVAEQQRDELLEALKELTATVVIHSRATANNFAWAELEEARAALAKVTGDVA